MTLEDLIKEERKEARMEAQLELIQKKLAKGQSVEQIADALELDCDTIQKLINKNLS